METVKLIRRLGGPVAIARLLGVTHGCITNWYRRGIPDGAKWRLLRLARARGIDLRFEDLEGDGHALSPGDAGEGGAKGSLPDERAA